MMCNNTFAEAGGAPRGGAGVDSAEEVVLVVKGPEMDVEDPKGTGAAFVRSDAVAGGGDEKVPMVGVAANNVNGLRFAAATPVVPVETAPIAAGMEVVVGMNGEVEEEVKGPAMTPLVPTDDRMFVGNVDDSVDAISPLGTGLEAAMPKRLVDGNLLAPAAAAPKEEEPDALNAIPKVETLGCFIDPMNELLLLLLLVVMVTPPVDPATASAAALGCCCHGLWLLDVMGEDPNIPPIKEDPVLEVLDMNGLPLPSVTFDATTMLLLCCSASSPSSRPVDDDTADDDDDDDDVSSEAVETGAVALVSSLPLPRRLDPVEEEDVVETTAVITSTSDGLIDIGIDSSS
jgi:hypothetical protein